jgi:hypothetical protein
MCAVGIQFHQGGQIDRFVVGEFPGRQRFVSLDGVQDFLRLFGLATSEIGRFEPASVVLALRPAALVGGFLMRGSGGLFQNLEVFG